MARKATKPAYERKNPHAADEWAKRKEVRNKSKVVVQHIRPWPLSGREGYISPEGQ